VSEQPTAEDRALLAALAELEGGIAAGGGSDAAGAGDAETETLARLYHETLGLVPFALPPAAPRPELRRRLLERVGAAAVGGTAEGAGAREGARGAGARPADARPAEARAASSRPVEALAAGGAPSRWPLALAAALVLALLGTCAWLYHGLLEQGATIAHLAGQRNQALRQAGELEDRLARLNRQVSSLRDSFSVVTSPAVEVCNLRAVTPDLGDARGLLFVAADHQHWYMSLRGLRPPGEGKVYQLWFVAGQGTVSGGTFGARPGAPAELGSEHMPAGTRGVRITLETSPGSSVPGGADVLRNADTLHTL
jgi:hypothetical protein